MSKKTVTTRTYSDSFYNAIKAILDVKVQNDVPVSRVVVAKALMKGEVQFGIDNLTLLATAVGCAVKEGHVEGYLPIRGRKGGIVNLAQRTEHIAQVLAAE